MRAVPLAAVLVAILLVACGDDSGEELDADDRGAGVGALGGSASAETLARTRMERRPSGEVAWVAAVIRIDPGEAIEHEHELAFVYTPADGDARSVPAGAPHRHSGGGEGAVVWEIRLARPGTPAPPGAGRRVFESEPLDGVPAPAEVSLIAVIVPQRGGRTTVHTHPGPEFIYQVSGRIDYQNAIIGTKRLGPGGAEGIPPGTAVQKRNPYEEPATFLSLFLVPPDEPFAPKASF